MNKLRMVRAYFAAVFAGIIVFDLIILMFLPFYYMFSGNNELSLHEFLQESASLFILLILIFLYEFPISFIAAAPFTLICFLLIGTAWNATHKNSILLGMACPLVSATLFSIVFIMPASASPDPESNRFHEYIVPAIAFGLALLPSGAVAGSVFWRLGLRTKASSIQPVLQNQ